MSLLLRRRMLMAGAEVWDYELFDQTYTGSNYTITPLYLYTAENIGKSCKIQISVDNITNVHNGTFFSTMKEVSPYPGMVFRINGGLQIASGIGSFVSTVPSSAVLVITRDGSTGDWTAVYNGITRTGSFANSQFTQALTIGAAYQGDGTTFFRYGKFHLNYFKFKWL